MGKHSSPEAWPFYRSAIAWFLPWALLATVATTAVAVAIDAVGSNEVQPPPAEVVASPPPSPTPTPEPEESPEPTPEEEEEEEEREPEPELITQGITVQVLNGTNSPGADDRIADRLARLGFEIIALNPARARDQTTVFWSSPEAREAARRLAARFGWEVGPKPGNLSPQVSIHVVVGADET